MPAGAALGFLALGAIGIVVLLVSLFIAGFVLYLGAKLVGIENATIGKSIIAVVGGGILAAILGIIPIIGWILGIIAYIWVIKVVFDTDWLKAFLAWIMTFVVALIVGLVLGAILGASLLAAL
ncbi:MAG: hypothetical protein PWQ79_1590 [Thermococcaceae archaeon]|nr:hypothetical protein [Thermococcaceae archaeon]MDK2914675.1 hypothetical protein [Thermococcaceae archaeon]